VATDNVVLSVQLDDQTETGQPPLTSTSSLPQSEQVISGDISQSLEDSLETSFGGLREDFADLFQRIDLSKARVDRLRQQQDEPIIAETVGMDAGVALPVTTNLTGLALGAGVVGLALHGLRSRADSLSDSFDKLVSDTRDFSGVISLAVAREDIQLRRAQRRRALELEEQIAPVIGARADIRESILEIRTTFEKLILGQLAEPLRAIADMSIIISGIVNRIEGLGASNFISGAIESAFSAIPGANELQRGLKLLESLGLDVSELRSKLAEWLRRQENTDEAEFDLFFNSRAFLDRVGASDKARRKRNRREGSNG
jgi:hypothetical protein